MRVEKRLGAKGPGDGAASEGVGVRVVGEVGREGGGGVIRVKGGGVRELGDCNGDREVD